MTWYAHSGPRRSETGKFRSLTKLGTHNTAGGQYRGWSYTFVAHQTGSGVRRTRYAVSIRDPHQNRAVYLRDFSSIKQAIDAAHDWIDGKLGFGLLARGAADIGKIPDFPTASSTAVQEK